MNPFRLLLFPFAWIYAIVTALRNYFYDRNIIKSFQFDFPVIVVGNLSTGGEGKTPYVSYLIRILSKQYAIAVLSRGYRRKTKGYILSTEKSLVEDIGDESKLIKQKYPQVEVAVCEERLFAIPAILEDEPTVQVIIMDDGLQHRTIKPGFAILLTAYHHLFTRDNLLPVGDLREAKSQYKRADIIIVTKCPPDLSETEKRKLIAEIRPQVHQQLFFSYYRYETPYNLFDNTQKFPLNRTTDLLLVCGIADPKPLQNYLSPLVRSIETLFFPDHHYYEESDLDKMEAIFSAMKSHSKIILTTEKDAVRLTEHEILLKEKKMLIYCQPIEVTLDNESAFTQKITTFIESYENKNE